MYRSPLRYPGGKAKIAPFMKDIIRENRLFDGIYVEPFAGGAGVALELLFEEYVRKIYLNDLDISIYSFWDSILHNTAEFCSLIENTPLTISEWKHQKDVQRHKEDADPLELGFSTFYLNRTNRSGIIGGGVIGGFHQSSVWKMDVRYNKPDLIARIKKIAAYEQRIQLFNMDGGDFIEKIVAPLPENTLIYFDPPYYEKGKALYVNHYRHDDHVRLREVISNCQKKYWVLTYDNVHEIEELYRPYRHFEYSLSYSVANKGSGHELLFVSDKCMIPKNIRLNLIDPISM